LAEAHLGDGERWRDLYERNRDVQQPDGRRLRRPELIRPGWVLSLPDDAADAAPEERRGHRRDDRSDRAAARTADDTSDPAPPRTAPVPASPLVPRTLPRPEPATESTTPSPVPPGGAGPAAGVPAESEPDVQVASASRPEPQPLTLPVAGSALLAAGLVAMLARRRRQWLRRRRPGAVLDPVDAEAAELERWLRSMAEHDLSHRTDRLLRLLTGHFAEHEVQPAVLALEIGERVTLVLSKADRRPPPGFTASDDGRTWLVDAELEVAAPHDDGLAPFIPARVACGVRPTGEIVVLNLLAAGVVIIEGEDPAVEEALTSWTAELASGGAASGVELVVVGRHHHVVEQFARVVVADDPRAALARVERLLAPAPDQAPSHVVVLSATPARGPAWDALRRRTADEPRLALVTAGDREVAQPDIGCHLRLDGDGVLLDPPGIRLAAPEWLTPQTWEHLGDLLAQPARERPGGLMPSPLLASPMDRDPSDARRGPSDRMVRVLGPLVIEGVATEHPCTSDVLAYLAVHRDGAELATLAGEVAPGPSGAAAVRSAVTALQDGDEPVVITRDGHLRLAGDVISDLERFSALTRRLDHQAPAEQAGAMQAALALVRGRPFDCCGAWADAEGLPTVIAALVADVAHRLATVVMTFGDLERARWAIDRGLQASPGYELLYRDRMRVADAAGDHVDVRAALRELRSHAAADDGWVSAETLQLFEQLTRSTTIAVPPDDDLDGHRHAS
jgi:hypothetical protein